jgi:3-methylcrotonyl-CoA carboxylase alpha subunit
VYWLNYEYQQSKVIHSLQKDCYSPWQCREGWQLNQPAQRKMTFFCSNGQQRSSFILNLTSLNISHEKIQFCLNGEQEHIIIEGCCQDNQIQLYYHGAIKELAAVIVGRTLTIFYGANVFYFERPIDSLEPEAIEESGHLVAPMPGTIAAVNVSTGQAVKKGDILVVMEAMKMEHTLYAPFDGIVDRVYFKIGELVGEGTELVSMS